MLAVQSAATAATVATYAPRAAAVYYRPLQPQDFDALKEAHARLFPIDYDDNFYSKAVHGLDRITSMAAFATGPYGQEQLVGFITARTTHLHEAETHDRQLMGLVSPLLDHDPVVYILTLGTLEGARGQGIASALIRACCTQAAAARCRAVYLHVIQYNTAAIRLYSRAGFTCAGRLTSFYHIATGRQPDPSTHLYDAYLYVQYLGETWSGAGPWECLHLAVTPLRSAWGRLHACMPSFCRAGGAQQPLLLPKQAAGAGTPAAAAAADQEWPSVPPYPEGYISPNQLAAGRHLSHPGGDTAHTQGGHHQQQQQQGWREAGYSQNPSSSRQQQHGGCLEDGASSSTESVTAPNGRHPRAWPAANGASSSAGCSNGWGPAWHQQQQQQQRLGGPSGGGWGGPSASSSGRSERSGGQWMLRWLFNPSSRQQQRHHPQHHKQQGEQQQQGRGHAPNNGHHHNPRQQQQRQQQQQHWRQRASPPPQDHQQQQQQQEEWLLGHQQPGQVQQQQQQGGALLRGGSSSRWRHRSGGSSSSSSSANSHGAATSGCLQSPRGQMVSPWQQQQQEPLVDVVLGSSGGSAAPPAVPAAGSCSPALDAPRRISLLAT